MVILLVAFEGDSWSLDFHRLILHLHHCLLPGSEALLHRPPGLVRWGQIEVTGALGALISN